MSCPRAIGRGQRILRLLCRLCARVPRRHGESRRKHGRRSPHTDAMQRYVNYRTPQRAALLALNLSRHADTVPHGDASILEWNKIAHWQNYQQGMKSLLRSTINVPRTSCKNVICWELVLHSDLLSAEAANPFGCSRHSFVATALTSTWRARLLQLQLCGGVCRVNIGDYAPFGPAVQILTP